MKLALLSDIHANLQAFEACLLHARAQGATQFALLGDLVGYGGDPVAVMDRIMQLAADGAWVVRGNHDAMAVAPPSEASRMGQATAAWTHDLPEERVIVVATAVVANNHTNGFGNGVKIGDELFKRLRLKVRVILQGIVQVGDVCLMMLAVVDLHRLGVDMGLERGKIIRQWRQGEFTHRETLWLIGFMTDSGLLPACFTGKHAGQVTSGIL